MYQQRDLACRLAPDLHALSTASTAIFNPLTSVMSALISELDSLRAAHDQLQEKVSRLEMYNQVSLPHSIPPPPNTTPPESSIIDPELTQPPPPIQHLTESEIDRPSPRQPYSRTNHQHQNVDSDTPHRPTSSQITLKLSPKKRLRRKRRSSKRPISDSATPSGRPEEHVTAIELTTTPSKRPCKLHEQKSSNSSIVLNVVSVQTPPASCKAEAQPMEVSCVKPELQQETIPTMKLLPTTPTTGERPKKRRTDPLTNDPVIEGFKSAAAAVRVAEAIVANREAENVPPAFRPDAYLRKTCEQCQNMFRAQAAEAFDPHDAFQALVKEGCVHQERISGPRTPEGYWAQDFPETPTQSPPQSPPQNF